MADILLLLLIVLHFYFIPISILGDMAVMRSFLKRILARAIGVGRR